MRAARRAAFLSVGFLSVSLLAQTAANAPHATAATPARPAQPVPGQSAADGPATGIARYSPYAAAGGYNRRHETFWEFWLRQFNPRNINYGAWIEERRRVFLAQAGANPYFWFSFWELAALCFLLLWVAKERVDRKDTEWEAAECMADLANYADYCKRNALAAIRKHNEHIEVCNRVIESAETGRPVTPAGDVEEWKRQLESLRTEMAQKTADNCRLTAELEQKAATVTDLSARVDELARQQNGKPGGADANPNLDLVARVNRLTAELQALHQENGRLKRVNEHAGSSERTR